MDTPTAVPITAQYAGAPAAGAPAAAAPARGAVERELAMLRARVRALSAELVQAREAACERLARELHDSVGAELTATRFALAGVETWLPADAPSQCTAALSVANRSLDAVCAASRQMLAQLHAPSLDAGLVGALAQWTADFSARTRLRTSFVCAADARLTRLPDAAALAVFRVAQEALNNVARHAHASFADVRIESNRRHLTLLVSDDGIGVARKARRRTRDGHFGLSGIEARCAAFDGTLRIGARRVDSVGSGSTNNSGALAGTSLQARFAWDALLAGDGADADAASAQRSARRAAIGRTWS